MKPADRQTRSSLMGLFSQQGLHPRTDLGQNFLIDLNLIDYENLSFEMPYMAYDLPANGRRLVQKAKGYVATFCNGVQTVDGDAFTDEVPGTLIKGSQTR